MIVAMLTTIDNPYSPFDDWGLWLAWDMQAGYNSSALLARIAQTSHEQSDNDFKLSIEQAIDEVVKENVSGMHQKVTKEITNSNDSSSTS